MDNNYFETLANSIQETHREEIQKAVEQKEMELHRLKKEYDSKLKEKDVIISELKATIDQTKSELVKSYEAKLDELKAKHAKRIEELKAKAWPSLIFCREAGRVISVSSLQSMKQ